MGDCRKRMYLRRSAAPVPIRVGGTGTANGLIGAAMRSLDNAVRNAMHRAIIDVFLLTYKPDGLGGFEDKHGRKAPARSVQHFYAAVAGAL